MVERMGRCYLHENRKEKTVREGGGDKGRGFLSQKVAGFPNSGNDYCIELMGLFVSLEDLNLPNLGNDCCTE